MRLRPIVMVTLAALLSALPLLLVVGRGSELRRPLGVAILGGLLTSPFLTLFSTPVVVPADRRIASEAGAPEAGSERQRLGARRIARAAGRVAVSSSKDTIARSAHRTCPTAYPTDRPAYRGTRPPCPAASAAPHSDELVRRADGDHHAHDEECTHARRPRTRRGSAPRAPAPPARKRLCEVPDAMSGLRSRPRMSWVSPGARAHTCRRRPASGWAWTKTQPYASGVSGQRRCVATSNRQRRERVRPPSTTCRGRRAASRTRSTAPPWRR